MHEGSASYCDVGLARGGRPLGHCADRHLQIRRDRPAKQFIRSMDAGDPAIPRRDWRLHRRGGRVPSAAASELSAAPQRPRSETALEAALAPRPAGIAGLRALRNSSLGRSSQLLAWLTSQPFRQRRQIQSKSTLAPMVNRVLTSPYLWWFDRVSGRRFSPSTAIESAGVSDMAMTASSGVAQGAGSVPAAGQAERSPFLADDRAAGALSAR